MHIHIHIYTVLMFKTYPHVITAVVNFCNYIYNDSVGLCLPLNPTQTDYQTCPNLTCLTSIAAQVFGKIVTSRMGRFQILQFHKGGKQKHIFEKYLR